MRTTTNHHAVRLTAVEMQRLCDLFEKCGEGDLLDFIHFLQRESKRWKSVEEMLSVFERLQEIEHK